MFVTSFNMRNLYVYAFVALVVITLIYMGYTGEVLDSSPMWLHYSAPFRTSHNRHNETTPPNPEHTSTSAMHRSNVTITPNTTDLANTRDNNTGVDNSRYLSIQRHGRLGNEMWQYSTLFGIAKLTNRTQYWTRPSWIYTVFNLTVPVEHAVKRFRGMKTVKERGVHHVQDAVADVQHIPHDVKLDGYYQSSEYFYHVTDNIRK